MFQNQLCVLSGESSWCLPTTGRVPGSPPRSGQPQRNPEGSLPAAWGRMRGLGGAGREEFTPEVQEEKGDGLRRQRLPALEEAGKRAVAQAPSVCPRGRESARPTCSASARPPPPAPTCEPVVCPSAAIGPSSSPSSITQHMKAAALTVLQARQKPLQEGPSLIPASSVFPPGQTKTAVAIVGGDLSLPTEPACVVRSWSFVPPPLSVTLQPPFPWLWNVHR